jgi:uncharacterized membrane protein
MDISYILSLPLHPPLSAFPFALIVMAAALEVLALRPAWAWLGRSAGVCIVAGAVFVVLAFLTGYAASEHADQTFQVPDEAIAWHHTVGRLLLFCVLPCAALKVISELAKYGVRGFRAAYFALLAVCLGLVVYTGYLGGQLVFAHGAGVYARPTPPTVELEATRAATRAAETKP